MFKKIITILIILNLNQLIFAESINESTVDPIEFVTEVNLIKGERKYFRYDEIKSLIFDESKKAEGNNSDKNQLICDSEKTESICGSKELPKMVKCMNLNFNTEIEMPEWTCNFKINKKILIANISINCDTIDSLVLKKSCYLKYEARDRKKILFKNVQSMIFRSNVSDENGKKQLICTNSNGLCTDSNIAKSVNCTNLNYGENNNLPKWSCEFTELGLQVTTDGTPKMTCEDDEER